MPMCLCCTTNLFARLGLVITSEKASEAYTTNFITSLFKEEGKKIFDVRESILGHLQQGGTPSAWDRYCIQKQYVLMI